MTAPDAGGVGMRRGVLGLAPLAGAALALCACGGSGSGAGVGAAAHRYACLPHGARVLADDGAVRVYSLPGTDAGRSGARTYACLVSSGKTLLLGSRRRAPATTLGHIAVAGPKVAYTQSALAVDSGCTSIEVLDVASGRTTLELPGVACSIDAGLIRLESVTDLVLSPGGAVAWIVGRGRGVAGSGHLGSFEVRSARIAGAITVLDQRRGIQAGSLRLSGGTLCWRRDRHNACVRLA